MRKTAMKNDKINRVTHKKLKLYIGAKCIKCGWWIESGEIAFLWKAYKTNMFTHIECKK